MNTMEERVATSAEAANEAPTARKKPRQIPSNSSANDATLPAISENPSGTGIRGSMHGDIFQLKLLMLFLVRGITSKYKFQLSTEMPGQGGKFDDLVFHYQDTPQGEYRYRYVQAKHKQGEDNRITASDLLNETNGDYSLQKYFRSYRNEIANPGQNVQDCIICTNIGFDDNVLGSKDFNLTLINSDDTLLGIKQYPNFDKVPARYQLNITRLDESKIFELLHESSEIHQLAKKLLEYANPKNKKKITNNVAIFKMYQVALVEEKVIDRETWKFHQEFITNSDLLPKTATKFRDVIFKFWNKDKKGDRPAHEFNDYLQGLQFDCSKDFGISKEKSDKTFDDVVTDEQIEDFLNKLVFAVDMPNEVRLGNILTEEVGQHFNLRGFDFQSSFMLEKMLDWLKKRQGTVMVTLDGNNLFEQTRQKMVALRATAFSIDFRSKYLPSDFLNSFQYQEETIAKTANALRDFLNSADSNKTLRISTRSFKCTTVKILSALETLPGFKDLDDGYLLMESQHLAEKHMKDWVKGAMKEEKSHHVLIVIMETPQQDERYEEDFMPVDQPRKKMIVICSDENVTDGTIEFQRDEFDCKMLSDETINKIISTQVAFQGNEKTLGDLVGGRNGLSEMLDSSSVEEILFHRSKVDIPSFKPQEFEKSLWIERFLLPPPITLDEDFLHELTKELGYTRDKLDKSCKFNPRTNRINWLINDTVEKSTIWTKVEKLLLKKKESIDTIPDSETPMICGSIPEIKLATGSELKSCFIITGVAGSGKSTALSRHYEHVKTANSNVWVITINLIKHSKHLSKLAINTASDAVEFLVNFPGVTGDGAFARSLLKNRLINTGGVVLMLDGFDEINKQCKDTIIRLIKAISDGKTKLDRLLITTRPHLAKRLQDELFQFAFSLENLGKDHQVEYLMKYWQNKMTLIKEEIARKFANDLIDRVSEALKDKERTFIGIPLQCRILAECFQPQIESLTSYSAPEIGSNYNVAQLYHMLFQKKRDIFQNKKATGSTDFDLIVKWALEEFLQTIDSYHFKLAIDTIFEEKYANLLWPPQQLSDRQSDEDMKEEKMRRYALQFGLTSIDTQNTRKLQFLHRTFAEYLVAEFLYKGILSDDNKHKDQIRDSDGPLLDFVIRHIFVENSYEGVRIFLDSMLKDMAITNQTWRDTIPKSINESQPNQLQRFAHHFSFSMADFLSSGSGAEAFVKTIEEGNVGMFDFMLDCLGAIYDRHSVQEMVTKAIDIGLSHLFFGRSVEIHQRIVNFFSDAELKTVNVLLNLMVEHFPFARAQCYSNFPPKARKTYLAFLLDFMEKHQKNLANLLNLEFLSFYLLEPKGHFVFDPYYDEELRRFLKLVITNRYTTPSSVNYFEENLDYGGKAMGGRNENWVNGSIEKILTILKDLQQDKMLEKMSRAVLTSNPDLYQRFYRPCIFEKERMSELRESALKGDKHAIPEVRWQFLAAAVVGNEDVCEKMLRILSTNQDWTQLTELIENALRIATTQSADMWTLIVRVVRRHFDRQSNSGQETLRHVLTGLFDVIQGPLIESFDFDILHKVVQMEVTQEEDGADWFREILLGSTDSPTQMAEHYKTGFSLLLKHVLGHFNQQQLVKFIRLITSPDNKIEFVEGVGCSIWAAEIARTGAYIDRNWSANCYRFLELVTSRLDQESVINLLMHQEDNGVVLYRTALTNGEENFVNKICSRFLSPENRDTVISDFNEKAHKIILDLFDRYSREMLPYETKITALISFFVDHATDDQLLQLVDIITSSSYWEYLFDHLGNEDILKILARASKLPVGFEEVVRKLLSIDDIRGHGAIIIRAAQQRGDDFIQTVCALLPEISQVEIANFLKRHATQRIKEIFFSEELHWFWESDSEIRWNALNFFLNHGNDNQLSEMVNVLTTLRHVDERVCSIWNRCIEELANTEEFSGKEYPRAQVCQKLETFLEEVNEKIGGDAVIMLLLHKEGKENSEVVLIRIALLYLGSLSNDPYECTSRFTIKDTVLSQEKQVELRQLLEPAINQFKREKCDVNSPFWTSASLKNSHADHWTGALHFYLDYSTDPNLSADFFHIMTYKRPRWEHTETSIWEYFFGVFPEEVRECFHLLRHVSEKLGEDVVKKLALEKDGKGRFLLGEALKKHGHEYSVKSMYTFLSTQARNEVFHTLLDDPYVSSKLDVEIGSRSFSENTNGELLMYLELVKSVRQIDGKSRSIWTNFVGKMELNTEKFEQLLKLVLDKLGEDYLKQLILHDDDGDGESIISLATSQEHFSTIDAIFSFLSPASETEVRHKGYTATGLIDRMVSSKGSDYWIIRHLNINSADGTASNLPDGFDVLASYFIDKFNLDQLKNFVKLITSFNKVKRETRSIWGDYIRKVCSIRPFTKQEEENQKFSLSSIEHFFKVVSNRLGSTVVVKLLYHYDSSCVVINYFVLKDCPEIANMAFCQLEQHEKNGKIRFCPINGRPIVEQPIEPSLHQQQRGKKKRDRRANK